MKTLEQIKEDYAKTKRYKSWEDLINDQPSYMVEKLMDEISLIQARQACEQQREMCQNNPILKSFIELEFREDSLKFVKHYIKSTPLAV